MRLSRGCEGGNRGKHDAGEANELLQIGTIIEGKWVDRCIKKKEEREISTKTGKRGGEKTYPDVNW